jgi:hypothetical protein
MALIRVDGRPLLDIIREVESPLAAAGEPDLAGKYDYLNAMDVLFPSRQLLGAAVRPLLDYGEKVSVLECECGCEGCWPLLMRITVTEDSVVWRDPQQPHRDNWHYPPGWHLAFDHRQYEESLDFPPEPRRSERSR